MIDVLIDRTLQAPDSVAFKILQKGEEEGDHFTYAELERRARELGAWLQRKGLADERALLLFQPGLDFISAFFGCLFGGTVAVPANLPRQNRSLNRLISIVRDVRPRIGLTTSDLLPRIQSFAAEAGELGAMEWLAVDELAAQAGAWADGWRHPGGTQDRLAFLQYTSGSTSSPKGVMVSHGNLLHNCEYLRFIAGDDADSVGVTWLPHFHDMGLIDGILHPVYSGYPCYVMSPLDFLMKPARWLRAISRYRATNSGGPNFAFDLCARKIGEAERQELDLSSWRMAYNGAEPVRSQTLQRFAAAFEPCGFRWRSFYPVYGLAEATLVVSSGRREDEPCLHAVDAAALEENRVVPSAAEAGSRVLVGCGRAWCGTEVVIVDPASRTPCADGGVGEIWLRGPSVAQGYWNRPEETQATFGASLADGEGPFLRTGDLGFLAGEELFISGRLKDLIILGGRNLHPQDIELTVEQCHPAMRPAGCAAFTVEMDGEERLIVAAEVGRPRRGGDGAETVDLSRDRLVRAIRQAAAEQHDVQIHEVVLLKPGSIPKTSSGKLQRQACRAGFLSQELMQGRVDGYFTA